MICSNSQMVLNKTLIKQKQMAFNKVLYKHAQEPSKAFFFPDSLIVENYQTRHKRGNHPLTCDLRKCLRFL